MTSDRRTPLRYCWDIWRYDSASYRHDLETVVASRDAAIGWIIAQPHVADRPCRVYHYAMRRTATEYDRAMIAARSLPESDGWVAIGLRIGHADADERSIDNEQRTPYI